MGEEPAVTEVKGDPSPVKAPGIRTQSLVALPPSAPTLDPVGVMWQLHIVEHGAGAHFCLQFLFCSSLGHGVSICSPCDPFEASLP